MMHIDILAAVPELMFSAFKYGLVARAIEKQLVIVDVHNLHHYADNQFGHIDDTVYGGGAGMVIRCEPVFACVEKLQSQRNYDEVVFLCPDGYPLTQTTCNALSLKRNLILIAGHYKGIDQRIRDRLVTKEISIGDFIVSGGELPATMLVDAVVRLLPGAMQDSTSALEDSFMDGMLEPPIYTKPRIFRGDSVPQVLLGGNHVAIKEWRNEQQREKTSTRRPDLLGKGEADVTE